MTANRRTSQTFPTYGAPKVREAREAVPGKQTMTHGQYEAREIYKFRRQR